MAIKRVNFDSIEGTRPFALAEWWTATGIYLDVSGLRKFHCDDRVVSAYRRYRFQNVYVLFRSLARRHFTLSDPTHPPAIRTLGRLAPSSPSPLFNTPLNLRTRLVIGKIRTSGQGPDADQNGKREKMPPENRDRRRASRPMANTHRVPRCARIRKPQRYLGGLHPPPQPSPDNGVRTLYLLFPQSVFHSVNGGRGNRDIVYSWCAYEPTIVRNFTST